MSRFIQILPFSLLALCLAQEDSGLYVNRMKIETFHNGQADKTFTYYVSDNYDQSQIDNYKTEAGSIGSIFEDDYADDTVSCTVSECPKLRRIYSYISTAGGVTTTRILDSALKTSTGASSAKPIGFVAPYPGYCSSDDSKPIIELYSEGLKKYAYWSPAQPNQLVNIDSTTIDKARYIPTRLVGYALAAEPERLVLENASPDFVKPIGRANYTHSFFPTNQLIQFNSADNMVTLGTAASVDSFNRAGYTSKNTGVFILAKAVSAQTIKLDAVCGERITIYSAWNSATVADQKFVVLFPRDVKLPYTALAQAGFTFKTNKPACGGIKGLAALKEFQHKTKAGYFTYENDPVKIQSLTGTGQWTVTNKDLGFAPLDQIGFALINAVL